MTIQFPQSLLELLEITSPRSFRDIFRTLNFPVAKGGRTAYTSRRYTRAVNRQILPRRRVSRHETVARKRRNADVCARRAENRENSRVLRAKKTRIRSGNKPQGDRSPAPGKTARARYVIFAEERRASRRVVVLPHRPSIPLDRRADNRLAARLTTFLRCPMSDVAAAAAARLSPDAKDQTAKFPREGCGVSPRAAEGLLERRVDTKSAGDSAPRRYSRTRGCIRNHLAAGSTCNDARAHASARVSRRLYRPRLSPFLLVYLSISP